MKKILILLAIGMSVGALAQQRQVFGRPLQSINPKNNLVRCVSTEYEEFLESKDPNRATRQAFEEWIAPKVAQIKADLLTRRSVQTVVTIPVVVHVIHNGDAVGSNENISDARVLSQIAVLNEDFRRMLDTPGYNENPDGADIELEFCMAVRKPDGTPTNGIDRVNLGVAQWSTETQVETNLKPNTIWDPTQYFNIWVAQFSTSASAELGGILGYAQFPSTSGLGGINANGGSANTDGVIIDWRCFGTSDVVTGNYFTDYDKGRTATHEIGHCFGLIHIWGDNNSCTVNATDSQKDYCPDTPAASQENYDCDAVYDSCPSAAGNDMTENYMDYTNDICMNTFTLDQKARILAVLQNSVRRASLKASTACATLGVGQRDKLQGMKLYPNPASEYVIINADDSFLPDSYELYNALGQLVSQKSISDADDLKITTAGLGQGVYFVKITKEDSVKTLRFVKE